MKTILDNILDIVITAKETVKTLFKELLAFLRITDKKTLMVDIAKDTLPAIAFNLLVILIVDELFFTLTAVVGAVVLAVLMSIVFTTVRGYVEFMRDMLNLNEDYLKDEVVEPREEAEYLLNKEDRTPKEEEVLNNILLKEALWLIDNGRADELTPRHKALLANAEARANADVTAKREAVTNTL